MDVAGISSPNDGASGDFCPYSTDLPACLEYLPIKIQSNNAIAVVYVNHHWSTRSRSFLSRTLLSSHFCHLKSHAWTVRRRLPQLVPTTCVVQYLCYMWRRWLCAFSTPGSTRIWPGLSPGRPVNSIWRFFFPKTPSLSDLKDQDGEHSGYSYSTSLTQADVVLHPDKNLDILSQGLPFFFPPCCFIIAGFNDMAVEPQVLRDRSISELVIPLTPWFYLSLAFTSLSEGDLHPLVVVGSVSLSLSHCFLQKDWLCHSGCSP